MTQTSDHILVTASEWQNASHALAIAVVVRTWGSSRTSPNARYLYHGMPVKFIAECRIL
jgi:hypothetical protein